MINKVFVGHVETLVSIENDNKIKGKNTAKIFVINPSLTLKNNSLHIKIIMDSSHFVSLSSLQLLFHKNTNSIKKVLYASCQLDKKAFSYSTHKDNPGKLYVLLVKKTESGDTQFFSCVKKYESLVKKLDIFSGGNGLEIEDAKSLVDNDITCGSTTFVDQNNELLLLDSPKVFEQEKKDLDGMKIYIRSGYKPDENEILEKTSHTTKPFVYKSLGFIPQIGNCFKPKTIIETTGTYHIKFEICTRK